MTNYRTNHPGSDGQNHQQGSGSEGAYGQANRRATAEGRGQPEWDGLEEAPPYEHMPYRRYDERERHAAGRVIVASVNRKPRRHRRGWGWLIAAGFGTVALLAGLLFIAGEIGSLGEAVREQTGVLREQNGLLNSLEGRMDAAIAGWHELAAAVKEAASQIATVVKDNV